MLSKYNWTSLVTGLLLDGLNEKSPRSALYRTERRTRLFLVKSAPCGARTHDLRIKSP